MVAQVGLDAGCFGCECVVGWWRFEVVSVRFGNVFFSRGSAFRIRQCSSPHLSSGRSNADTHSKGTRRLSAHLLILKSFTHEITAHLPLVRRPHQLSKHTSLILRFHQLSKHAPLDPRPHQLSKHTLLVLRPHEPSKHKRLSNPTNGYDATMRRMNDGDVLCFSFLFSLSFHLMLETLASWYCS